MKAPADVPSLLTMPYYNGTLAAARHLAGRGVAVVVASDRLLAPAFWSRHVDRRVASPSLAKGPAAVARWLCEYGEAHPGMVLHPTSDDMAFVIARYADELRKYFHLYVAPISAVRSVLDKSELYALCRQQGVPVPKTWSPRSEREFVSLCEEGRTLLLKPRSQMFLLDGGKGETINGPVEARAAFRLYRAGRYAPGMLEEFPELDLPLLQEYEPSATQGTYSISGFVDPQGSIIGPRASTKLLQTARVGIGMCFVASPLDATALGHIERLCRSIGYVGAFEIEFVRRKGELLLIDFNPRYYGQMGFDIARGSALPWLMHEAALGRPSGFEELLSEPAPPKGREAPTLYQDRVALTWWLWKALASGAVDVRDVRRWQSVGNDGAQRRVDASWRSDDPVPTVVAAAALAWNSLRHPATFLRSLRKNAEPYQQPIAPRHTGAPAPASPVRVEGISRT